ncbi:MAG: type IV pilin protein [Gammaproteobacteria bacterium]|nr:type IV pilin protein [Gammaproteobacteria bacterium]
MKAYVKNSFSNHKFNQGFTLIELMIVIVIVGILASIALPAYTEQMRKGRRSDGMAALLQVAQAQERFFTRNFSYSNDINTELGFGANPYVSEEGFYNIAIAIPGACVSGAVNSCFTATATAIGGQSGDAKCSTMTINNRGEKTSANGGTDTTGQCW